MSEARIVATVSKNHRETIRVVLAAYKGHAVADLRVYVGDGPKAVATRKGLTVRRELLPDLAAAIIAACRHAGLPVPTHMNESA